MYKGKGVVAVCESYYWIAAKSDTLLTLVMRVEPPEMFAELLVSEAWETA